MYLILVARFTVQAWRDILLAPGNQVILIVEPCIVVFIDQSAIDALDSDCL